MKLLVTGAAGFVGTNAVAHFLLAGASVTALLRASEDPEGYPARVEERVEFLGGEAAELPRIMGRLRVRPGEFQDAGLLAELVGRHPNVLHTAGQVAGSDVRRHEAVNVGLVARLAACEAWTPEHRLITLSSVAAQGPGESAAPIPEDAEPRPRGAYGTSKRGGELAILGSAYPGRLAIVRPCSIIGPGDTNFEGIFRRARQGQYVQVGSLEKWYQIVHVLDLVRVIERLFRRLGEDPPPPRILHVAPPVIEHEDFRAAFEECFSRPVKLVHLGPTLTRLIGWVGDLRERLFGTPLLLCSDKMADMLLPYWVHSSALLEETLGGVEWTPLAEACRETDRWYRRNGRY